MRRQACYSGMIKAGIPLKDAIADCDLALILGCVYGKKKILEIGTKFGRTAINLAKYAADDGKVFTIDIDQSQDKKHLEAYPEYLKKIEFIEADTLKADWPTIITKYGLNNIDVAIIDGGHSAEAVKSDTMNVLTIMAADGLVFWHDFGNLHEPDIDEPRLGRKSIITTALEELDIPVIPIGAYMAVLDMAARR